MKKNIKKQIKIVLIFLIFITGLVVPLSVQVMAEETEEPLYGGTLRIAQTRDPISFNTILNYWFGSATYQRCVYDRLITYDVDWNLRPELAEWWEIYDEGKTHVFHLRRDVKWHDGEPFTSADVKWHFENVAKGFPLPCLSTPKFGNLISIEAPDDYTVIFRYSYPTLLNIYAYTQSGVMILPKHIYENDDAEEFKLNPANWAPIGTGPFKVTEYIKEQYIIMEANEDYFKGRPYLDKLIWREMPDMDTIVLAFQKGEVEFWNRPRAIDLEVFDKMPELSQKAIPSTRITGIQFNCLPEAEEEHPWLKDKNVRLALIHAIDQKAILDELFFGTMVECHNIPSIAFTDMYNWEVHNNFPQYDPELAERLLDEAGYPRGPDGVRFKFTYLGSGDFAEILRYYLGEIGVEMELFATEYATGVEQYMEGGWPAEFPMGGIGTGVGPEADLKLNFHGNRTIGAINSIWYNNDRVNEIVEELMIITDQPKRTAMILEFQELIAEDARHFILYSDTRRWVWNSDEFAGFENHPAPVYVIDPIGYGVWWKEGSPAEEVVIEVQTVTTTQTTTVAGEAEVVTQTETVTKTATTGLSTSMAIGVSVITAIIGAVVGFFIAKRS